MESILLTVFVGLTALSMLIQAIAVVRLSRSAREMREQLNSYGPRLETLLASAQQTVEQSRQQIQEVTSRANEVLDSTRAQLARMESVLADATTRAKSQIERVDLVLDDTISRVHETVASLHAGVLRPLRELNAVSAGIRAVFSTLLHGARPSVAQATQDEEMFI